MRTLQDTFEDAPDITPRPRATSESRSLTGRRTSSTSVKDRIAALNGQAEEVPKLKGREEGLKVNGHAAEEEQVKRLSMSEMDEVNLSESKSAYTTSEIPAATICA